MNWNYIFYCYCCLD